MVLLCSLSFNLTFFASVNICLFLFLLASLIFCFAVCWLLLHSSFHVPRVRSSEPPPSLLKTDETNGINNTTNKRFDADFCDRKCIRQGWRWYFPVPIDITHSNAKPLNWVVFKIFCGILWGDNLPYIYVTFLPLFLFYSEFYNHVTVQVFREMRFLYLFVIRAFWCF